MSGQTVAAARAMIFEAASKQVNSLSQQGAGEDIASQPLVLLAFKMEGQHLLAINPFTGLGGKSAAHENRLPESGILYV